MGGYCERGENEKYGKIEFAIGYDVTDVWEAAEKSLTFPKKQFTINDLESESMNELNLARITRGTCKKLGNIRWIVFILMLAAALGTAAISQAIAQTRTPYNFNYWDIANSVPRDMTRVLTAIKRGYAWVNMQERGQFFSEGEWDVLGAPFTDGEDEVAWMISQPWSNGKVGTTGCSSTAQWQLGVVAHNVVHHSVKYPSSLTITVVKRPTF